MHADAHDLRMGNTQLGIVDIQAAIDSDVRCERAKTLPSALRAATSPAGAHVATIFARGNFAHPLRASQREAAFGGLWLKGWARGLLESNDDAGSPRSDSRRVLCTPPGWTFSSRAAKRADAETLVRRFN